MSISVRLNHRFDGLELDVAFEAPPGVTVLFGQSGSGKTTVINAVAGLLRPQSGRVSVDGRTLFDTETHSWLPPHKRRLGYVFQEARLFPHLTVRQNLSYGRWFAPRDGQGTGEDFDKIVDLLGLGPLLDRRPALLSGGEKQRVAIGRAVLARPQLILADEPLAALDGPRKSEILSYFERLRDDLALPILYVSHSATEVARLATTVIALDGGKVVRQGPPTQVFSDPSFAPAGVRSVGAVLEARVACHHDDGLSELDAGGVPLFLPHVNRPLGTPLRVRIAAQDVMVSLNTPTGMSALNVLPGTVGAVRTGDGPGAIVSIDTAAGRVLARVTRRSVAALALSPGVACHAIVKTVAIAPEDVSGPPKAPEQP